MPRSSAVRQRVHELQAVLQVPALWGTRVTLRRRLNLYLNRYEHNRVRTRLRSYPIVLVVEPTNVCTLRCPYCFTGAGGQGRRPSTMPLALFHALAEQLGDRVLLVKFYNWGEPMLCPHLTTMIAAMSARGAGTVVNSHLSVPLDATRAEALVASGLGELVVSIDGARQETYERYRVGGRLALVVENIRLLAATKRRLGATRPRLIVEFHPFPWNAHEASQVAALADELGTGLRVFKGCVPGSEWGPDEPWRFCGDPSPMPCTALWTTAVVSADGGVAPCNGTFYGADDLGSLEPTTRFHDVWNGERFRQARSMFVERRASARDHVCFECPITLLYEDFRRYRAAGGDRYWYRPTVTTNDVWNYFWRRRPPGARRVHVG